MKTTALFLFLSLVMMGCDGQNKIAKSGNGCDRRIVIDKNKVGKSWEISNKKYYSANQIDTPKVCDHDHIYIDVHELEKDKIFPQWLKTNGEKICYKKTSDYIECEHLIINPQHIQALEQTANFGTLLLQDIENKINNLGGDFNNYDTYIEFLKDPLSKGGVDIKLATTFSPKGNYYSTPLIKSIKDNNKLPANSKFIFKEINGDTYFGVEISSGNYVYYDFSHIPPLDSEPATSPL